MQQNLSGNKFLKEKGFSMVEILVVSLIITLVLTSLLNLAVLSLKISTFVKESNEANLLAQEIIETTRIFRDGTVWQSNGLGSLTVGTSYYFEIDDSLSPSVWLIEQGEEVVGQFNRKIIFDNVQRNLGGTIVESGGINDPLTKRARAIVSWKQREIIISTYLTDWRQ